MILSADIVQKISRIDELAVDDPFFLLAEIGEDATTFFDHGRWQSLDFSAFDMRQVKFSGAVVIDCTFRAGDISEETKNSCLLFRGNHFVENPTKSQYFNSEQSQQKTVGPNPASRDWSKLVSAFHRSIQVATSFSRAIQVIAEMGEQGVVPRVGTFNEAVHKAKGLEDIRVLLRESDNLELRLGHDFFGHALKKFPSQNDIDQILQEMTDRSIQPTAATFSKVLDRARSISEVEKILAVMRERSIEPESAALTSFIQQFISLSDLQTSIAALKKLGIPPNIAMMERALKLSWYIDDVEWVFRELTAIKERPRLAMFKYYYAPSQVENMFNLLERARNYNDTDLLNVLEETLRYVDRPKYSIIHWHHKK